MINIPILSSLSESQFSNNYYLARSIGISVKRSEINNFILDHQINVFFIVETWLKCVGDEAKIPNLTPSGYATRSFTWANSGGLAIIAMFSLLSQNIVLKSSFSFKHNSFELFQATLSLEKRSVNFFCLQTST